MHTCTIQSFTTWLNNSKQIKLVSQACGSPPILVWGPDHICEYGSGGVLHKVLCLVPQNEAVPQEY